MQSDNITITEEQAGDRIDSFLSSNLDDLSRTKAQKLIKNELILVNEKKVTPHYKVKQGDNITIHPEKDIQIEIPDITVLFSNSDFIIIEKPAGLLSQPLDNKKEASVIDGLLPKFPELMQVGEQQQRFGLVHRLDRDVSGVMVIARTQEMFEYLKKQFQERKVKKKYTALVHEPIKDNDGVIDFPISRSKSGKMRATAKNQEGRDSITLFHVEKRFFHHTLVSARPQTGRMHQIRVHFKSIGHPIVGDTLYVIKKQETDTSLGRIFLHASSLEITTPDGESHLFESELPKQLEEYLTKIK